MENFPRFMNDIKDTGMSIKKLGPRIIEVNDTIIFKSGSAYSTDLKLIILDYPSVEQYGSDAEDVEYLLTKLPDSNIEALIPIENTYSIGIDKLAISRLTVLDRFVSSFAKLLVDPTLYQSPEKIPDPNEKQEPSKFEVFRFKLDKSTPRWVNNSVIDKQLEAHRIGLLRPIFNSTCYRTTTGYRILVREMANTRNGNFLVWGNKKNINKERKHIDFVVLYRDHETWIIPEKYFNWKGTQFTIRRSFDFTPFIDQFSQLKIKKEIVKTVQPEVTTNQIVGSSEMQSETINEQENDERTIQNEAIKLLTMKKHILESPQETENMLEGPENIKTPVEVFTLLDMTFGKTVKSCYIEVFPKVYIQKDPVKNTFNIVTKDIIIAQDVDLEWVKSFHSIFSQIL